MNPSKADLNGRWTIDDAKDVPRRGFGSSIEGFGIKGLDGEARS